MGSEYIKILYKERKYIAWRETN